MEVPRPYLTWASISHLMLGSGARRRSGRTVPAETDSVRIGLARRVRLPDRLLIVYKTQASGRQLKRITVVVRDGQTPTKRLARLTSTFDWTLSR